MTILQLSSGSCRGPSPSAAAAAATAAAQQQLADGGVGGDLLYSASLLQFIELLLMHSRQKQGSSSKHNSY